jgi:hypothetical protein
MTVTSTVRSGLVSEGGPFCGRGHILVPTESRSVKECQGVCQGSRQTLTEICPYGYTEMYLDWVLDKYNALLLADPQRRKCCTIVFSSHQL